MQTYEYKVIPAPNRPKRFKGVKGNAARFAEVLAKSMNDQAKDGWEYVRSDSMPVEEKAGLLKGRTENYHTVLVFRRAKGETEPEMAGYLEDMSSPPPPAPSQDFNYPQDPPLSKPEAEAEDAEEKPDPFEEFFSKDEESEPEEASPEEENSEEDDKRRSKFF
ncbi:MAG: DUF4177 domain-containing protein [Rhodobacteraceae bacterium]|nr:DUF4177 domain-containing protein [Paracoccaceae bacterium]